MHLECRFTQAIRLASADQNVRNTAVFGEVVGIHISDDIIRDGMLDYNLMQVIGRLGYRDYVRVNDIFAMDRPDYP